MPAISNIKVYKMNGLGIQFRTGLSYAKMPNSKKIFEPLWTGTVQGAILPHEDLLSKN
jgi:hypothetical protein